MTNPTEYPDIVYKYRSWTNEFHKEVLIVYGFAARL